MTKGFRYTAADGKLTFHDTGRTTLVIPDSIPVILLPTEETVTDYNAVWPDLSKDWMNTHQWNIASINGPGSEVGYRWRTAVPQEWSQTTTLMAAPSGADIFVGQIRLLRTAAPSHLWAAGTLAIEKMQPENVWISLAGGDSMLLEASLGYSRAMSIYLSGGNLVLHQQTSIGAAPGGFGTFGEGEPLTIFSVTPFTNRNGGETVYDGQPGWPLYGEFVQITNIPIDDLNAGGGNYFVPAKTRRGGANAPSFSDPTNYSSTWQFDLRGQFGRRS